MEIKLFLNLKKMELMLSSLLNKALDFSFTLFIRVWIVFALLFLGFLCYQFHFLFGNKTYTTYNLPEPYQSYFTEFADEADRYKKDIPKFDTLKVIIIDNKKWYFAGYCNKQTNTIYLNSSSQAQKVLIFHELGHCMFDYKHKANDLIMNTTILWSKNPDGQIWKDMKKVYFTSEYPYDFDLFVHDLKAAVYNSPAINFYQRIF